MNILLVDNYDSFTYNLFHLFQRFGADITVKRNDTIDSLGVLSSSPDLVVISPGPKKPSESGNTKEIVAGLYRSKPILGVCLGMQAINEVFGGRTVHALKPVHGKTSLIHHHSDAIFEGLPSPFYAARYHSLISSDIPGCLKVIASTEEKIPMAVVHREFPVCGVQFHPESFLTEYGYEIIWNFFSMLKRYGKSAA